MHWKPVQICALLKCICGIAWLRHFPKSDSKKKTWRVFIKNPAIFCMLWIGSFIIGLRVISLFRFGDRYERNPVQNCARLKCIYGIAWLGHFLKSDSKKKTWRVLLKTPAIFCMHWLCSFSIGAPVIKVLFRCMISCNKCLACLTIGDRFEQNPVQNCALLKCI